MTETMPRRIKIENLRAIAILSVVFGHSIILYSNSWNIYQTSWQVPFLSSLKDIINLYQMPLFIAISGYLFASRPPCHGFLPFLKKKAKRLLFPFLAVGICIMIPIKLFVSYPPYRGKSYFSAVLLLLKGIDTGHLWFLPTLFIIFLIAYAVVHIFGNKLSTWIIVTVFGLGANAYYNSIPLILPCFQYLRWVLEFFWSFSFGAMLFHLSEKMQIFKKRTPFLIGCIGIAGLLSFLKISGFLRFPTIAVSIMIVLSLFLAVSVRQIQLLHTLSVNSFGIYLLHSPLIYITFSFLQDANPFLVISINLFVFGGAAFLASKLLSKSKLKAIIGG